MWRIRLGDLTKRENRIAHQYHNDSKFREHRFPHHIYADKYLPFGAEFNSAGNYAMNPKSAEVSRYGEDVVLTNVVAFDVQVWDPTAPVFIVGNPPVAVAPGDPGFTKQLWALRRMQTIQRVLAHM